jgi:hypothetical protein
VVHRNASFRDIRTVKGGEWRAPDAPLRERGPFQLLSHISAVHWKKGHLLQGPQVPPHLPVLRSDVSLHTRGTHAYMCTHTPTQASYFVMKHGADTIMQVDLRHTICVASAPRVGVPSRIFIASRSYESRLTMASNVGFLAYLTKLSAHSPCKTPFQLQERTFVRHTNCDRVAPVLGRNTHRT